LALFLYKNRIFSSSSPITCAAVAVAPTQISDQNTTPEVQGFFGLIDRPLELHPPQAEAGNRYRLPPSRFPLPLCLVCPAGLCGPRGSWPLLVLWY
jgi:hypothetical protein